MRAKFAIGSLLLLASFGWAGEARVASVDAIGLTVSDLDRSIEFYTRVLDFERVSEEELAGEEIERRQGLFGVRLRRARLRLGDESIELTEYLAPRGRPAPVDARSNDRWFQHVAIIVSDMDRAYTRLRANRVHHASPGPQLLPAWNPNAGGIRAFYFRDPDGHPLEVLSFPEGKGDAKWHRATDRLFLGIDHTAIVIEDTEASLRFYRDQLGFRIAGTSENYGPEQERLNNVYGARLRITALRAESGPGIELLEYLAPGDGRPYPADAKPNDLLHWHTRLTGRDAAGAASALRSFRAVFLAPLVAENGRKTFLVRDPDGHAIEFAER